MRKEIARYIGIEIEDSNEAFSSRVRSKCGHEISVSISNVEKKVEEPALTTDQEDKVRKFADILDSHRWLEAKNWTTLLGSGIQLHPPGMAKYHSPQVNLDLRFEFFSFNLEQNQWDEMPYFALIIGSKTNFSEFVKFRFYFRTDEQMQNILETIIKHQDTVTVDEFIPLINDLFKFEGISLVLDSDGNLMELTKEK